MTDTEAYDIAKENVKIEAKKIMKRNPSMKIDDVLSIAEKGMVEKAENMAAALTGVEDAMNDKKFIEDLKKIKKEASKN